ncbi:MAG: hypothetical protein K2X71_17590 [Methylobacterium sp.]|uniref:DUF6163 family protein n=1 Tax=Methylobacterium sp. TaxID=409 RepID=UPI00258DBC05|nr:DUF6163 family protein [Methylobacterium sp.]MBY0297820.1 hypothetical protein [Methylobacterium sp.]
MRGLAKVKAQAPRRIALAEDGSDRIERTQPSARTRWDVVLVWFMRIVAVIWMLKGLSAWAEILGARPDAPPFEGAPIGRQAVIIYFGVIDLLAAVGLWLASAWGGVVWLLAATSAFVLALLTPLLLPMSLANLAFDAVIVTLYFIVSWLASREIR